MTNVCPWCDGKGVYHNLQLHNNHGCTIHEADYEPVGTYKRCSCPPCSHPPRVTIRAVGEFHTTRFDATGEKLFSKLHRTWTPPTDVGKAFARACRKPVPPFEDDAPARVA